LDENEADALKSQNSNVPISNFRFQIIPDFRFEISDLLGIRRMLTD